MNKKELHELLDLVLAIGASSKHFVSFEINTREYKVGELNITVYIFEHENGVSKKVCDSLDITASTIPVKAWLEAWAKIVQKERDYETN